MLMNDLKNKRIPKRRWPWIIGGVLLVVGLWQLVADHYQEEEKQLRRQLRETVKEKFPEQTARLNETFGLFYFDADGQTPGKVDANHEPVVLIHGLDDPGQVWQNLAPARPKSTCCREAGF
jgi:hypothetical protein